MKTGVLAALPLFPGIVSVGVLYGVTATEAGMPPWSVVATSLLVATGTAQFMALELLGQGTAWWLVVLIGLLVNLRYAVYSIHLGLFARALPRPWRLAYFGLVTDEGYALTSPLVAPDRPGLSEQLRWSAGVMVPIWLAWQIGTAIGASAGQVIPPGLELEMAIPITLLAVLVLLTVDWRHVVVAVGAGGVALVLRDAPYNLGLLAAMATGVAVGSWLPASVPVAPEMAEERRAAA